MKLYHVKNIGKDELESPIYELFIDGLSIIIGSYPEVDGIVKRNINCEDEYFFEEDGSDHVVHMSGVLHKLSSISNILYMNNIDNKLVDEIRDYLFYRTKTLIPDGSGRYIYSRKLRDDIN